MDNKKKINSSKAIGFDTLTDILSGIAFGLIFIFALPGLFGVIAAGITAALANEEFFLGELNLGVFIIAILFALPFGFWLFYRTRKKTSTFIVNSNNYPTGIALAGIIALVPGFFSNLLFTLLNPYVPYPTFESMFQIIGTIVFSLGTGIYWLFFKIDQNYTQASQEQTDIPESPAGKLKNNYITKYSGNFTQLIYKVYLVKAGLDVIGLVFLQSIWLSIITNFVLILTTIIVPVMIYRMIKVSSTQPDNKIHAQFLLLDYIKGIYLIIPMISFAIAFYTTQIQLISYILFISFCILKIGLIYIQKLRSQRLRFFTPFQKHLKFQPINDSLSAVLLIGFFTCSILFSDIFLLSVIGMVIFTAAFLVESFILNNTSKLREFLLVGSYIFTNILFCFFYLSWSWHLELLLWTFLMLIGEIVFQNQITFTKKLHKEILWTLYSLLFLELGVAAAYFTVNANWLIFHYPFLNYLFFLNLAFLGVFYSNRIVNKEKTSKKIEFGIVFSLIILQLGIFLLIFGSIFYILNIFINYNNNFVNVFSAFQLDGLFSKIFPNIQNIADKIGGWGYNRGLFFQSTDLLFNLFSLFVSFGISVLILNGILFFHQRLKLLSTKLVNTLQFVIILALAQIGACISFFIFGNFTGIIIGIYIWILVIILNLKRIVSFFSPPRSNELILNIKQIFSIYQQILFNFLLFFIFMEFLVMPPFLSLFLAVLISSLHYSIFFKNKAILSGKWKNLGIYSIGWLIYRCLTCLLLIPAVFGSIFAYIPDINDIFLGIFGLLASIITLILLGQPLILLHNAEILPNQRFLQISFTKWVIQTLLVGIEIILLAIAYFDISSRIFSEFLISNHLQLFYYAIPVSLMALVRFQSTKMMKEFAGKPPYDLIISTGRLLSIELFLILISLAFSVALYEFVFVIFLCTFLLLHGTIIILSKFTPLYPKLSNKLQQAQNLLHLFNILIITLSVGFFTLEIFQSSIAFALFIATIFAFVYLRWNVIVEKTISPKMNSILKGFLLVGHGILCLPVIISTGIWQFSSLNSFLQLILVNFSLFYGIVCLERTSNNFRVNNITGEKFQEIFRFVLIQATFITLYSISSGLLGLITSIPAINDFFTNSTALILFYALFPSILLYWTLKLITTKQHFKTFERMSHYMKVESLIAWNIFTISQLIALILLFPGIPALYIGFWMIFNFAQIITVKEISRINAIIAPKVKFVVDLIIMINSLLVTVGFYLLLNQIFNIGVNISIFCSLAFSNIVFGNVRQFTRYFMKFVFVGIKLLLLNGFFISLHIYVIRLLIQIGALNSNQNVLMYVIPVSLLYYLPLLKHNLNKFRELNLISQKNWHLGYFLLLNIQYPTICLTSVIIILGNSLLFHFVVYDLHDLGIILLVISACLGVVNFLYLGGSHNWRFKEYPIYQKIFLYEFHLLTYTALTLASIGIVFLTNIRLDVIFALLSVNGIILIHKLRRIIEMSLRLTNILQMGILFLKRILLCLIATSILLVCYLDFGWRMLTSSIIVLTLLAPTILFIPYFKKCIPEKIKWQFWAFYLLVSGMLGFESLYYVLDHFQPQAFIPILLTIIFLPLVTINHSIKLLEMGGLGSKLAFHLRQVVFLLFLGDICAISYLSLHSFLGPYFYLLIISIILLGIITFDFYHDKLLTGSKLLLITGLSQFLLISTGFTLFFADILTDSLEKQIFGGIAFGILFLKGGISQTERIYENWVDKKMAFLSDSESVEQNIVENDSTMTQEDRPEEPVVSGDLLDNVNDSVSTPFHESDIPTKATSEEKYEEIPAGFTVIEFLHQKYLGFQRILIISIGMLIGYFWIRIGTMNVIDIDFSLNNLIIAILGLTLSYTLKEIMGSEPNFWKSSLNLGINIVFYFSISFISTQYQIFSVILSVLILGTLQKGITHRYPDNPLQSYLENILFLFLYSNIFFILIDLHISGQLLLSTTSFIIFSRKKYLDLLFVSVFVLSLSNFLITLFLYLDLSLYSSIGISVFMGILGEWILFGFSTRWQKSRLKKFLGFSSYAFGMITFAFVSYDYYSILQYVIPVVLAISIVIMIFLQKQEMLSHRKPVYHVLIFSHTLLFYLSIGYCYIFNNLEFKYALVGSFACALSLFTYFFYFNKFEIPISKNLIKLILFTSGTFFALNVFLLLIEPNLVQLPVKIALPVALDFFVFIYFIGVGLYLGKFSKEIWIKGAIAWLFVPLVNFILVFEAISGIDSATLSLRILDISLNGSIILAIIICSLLYLPYLVTKLKKYIDYFVYGLWLETLVFIIWGSINLFPENIIAQVPFSGLIGVGISVPYFYFRKRWKELLVVWPIVCALNLVFFSIFFSYGLQWEIPLNFFIGGLYILIYAQFPIIRAFSNKLYLALLAGSFLVLFGSLYALLYSFLIVIFIDSIITTALTSIIMCFGMIPGKFFKIHTKILKPIFSVVLAANTGLVIWRVFNLITVIDFRLFGIFLGLSFMFALLLLFQVMDYLLAKWYQISWFLMALCFGLAAFEVFSSVFNLGSWVSSGMLVLVGTLISYPLIKDKLIIPSSSITLGFALILNQFVIPHWNVATTLPALTFLNILAILFLGLGYLGYRMIRFGVFANKFKNYLIFLALWVFNSLISALNLVITLTLWTPLQWHNSILFYLNFFAIFSLLAVKMIKQSQFLSEKSNFDQVLEIVKNFIIYTLYSVNALLIGFLIPNLPDSPLFWIARLLFILISTYIFVNIIDRYLVQAIPEKIRLELQWINFVLISIIFSVIIYGILESWHLSLIFFSLLNFYSLYLIRRIRFGKLHTPLIISNTIILNISLFAYLYSFYNLSLEITEYYYLSLLILVTINMIINYVFVRVHILPQKLKVAFHIMLNLSFALLCSELFRVYLDQSGTAFLNILNAVACFILVFALLNILYIKSNVFVSLFWLSIAFPFSIILLNGWIFVKNLLSLEFNIFENILFYGSFLALIIHVIIQNRIKTMEFSLTDKDPERSIVNGNFEVMQMAQEVLENHSQEVQKSFHLPKFKIKSHKAGTYAQKIYIWFEIALQSVILIALNHFWNAIFVNVISQETVTPIYRILLWISSGIMLIPIFGLGFKSQCTHHGIPIEEKDNFVSNNLKIRTLGLFLFELSLFIHLWPLLDITSSLLALKFDRLLLNLLIVNISLFVIMQSKRFFAFAIEIFQLIVTSLISLYIFENLRLYVPIDLLSIISITIFIFAILNVKYLLTTVRIYLFWTITANLLTILTYWLPYSSDIDNLLSFDVILVYLFIFGIFMSLFLFEINQRGVFTWHEEKIIQNSKIRYLNIPQNLFQGTDKTELRQKIYISWMSIYFSLTTVFLTYFANKLLFSMEYFTSDGPIFSILLVCISGSFIFSLGFCYVWNYLIKKDMIPPQIKNFQQFRDLWVYTTGWLLSLLLFLVLWPRLQILTNGTQWIFYPLLVNIILAVGLLYSLIALKLIPTYGKKVLKILITLCMTLLVEELLRSFTPLTILFRISLSCIMFAFMNRREIKNSILAVLMLVVYLCGFTGVFIEATLILLPDMVITDRILTTIFVFTVMCTVLFMYLAKFTRIQNYAIRLKLPQAIKIDPIGAKEIISTDDLSEYLHEIPYYIKIFDTPNTLRYIYLIWQLILPLFLIAPLTKIYHVAMNFLATLFWQNLTIDFSILLWVLITIQWIGVALFMSLQANRYNRLHQLRSQFEDFNLFPTKILKTSTILLYTAGSMILGIYTLLLGSNLSPFTLITIIVVGICIVNILVLTLWEIHVNQVLSERLVQVLTLVLLFSLGISSYLLITAYFKHWFTAIYLFAYFIGLKYSKYSKIINYVPIYHLSILGMYLSLFGIISYYIWIILPWNFSIILIAGLLYLTVLLESKIESLKGIIPNYTLLKIATWTIFCLASLLMGIFLLYPVFRFYQIIGAFILFSFEVMHLLSLMDSIHFLVDPTSDLYSKLRKSVIYVNYLQGIALILNFLIWANLLSTNGYLESIPFTRMILATEMILTIYILTAMDHTYIKNFPQNFTRRMELVFFVLLVISGAFDLGYWLFFIVDLPSIITLALLSQIMGLLLVITVSLAVALYFKLKNRKANQLFYFAISMELLLFLVGREQVVLAIIVTGLILILFPVIFYLENVIEFFKDILKGIIRFFQWIKDSIERLFFAIVNWIKVHIRFAVTSLAIILSGGTFYFFRDIFISGLIFLAIFYWVSPERESETKQSNFGKRLVYRLFIFVCLFGTTFTNDIIPLEGWIISLILLPFLGYVIWAVRKSEEIYNLSTQWRFWSSLFAIIDFVVTIFLILNMYYF